MYVLDYEEVRNDQNVKFQGILHKKGQNNKEWKVRIFSMNPDTGFYIRYFTEDSKLEVGYERGSIDVEDSTFLTINFKYELSCLIWVIIKVTTPKTKIELKKLKIGMTQVHI